HEEWHPVVSTSAIERNLPSDKVGCVRRFTLADGSELRERLLTLSDADMAFTYCLEDTPIPLLNYVAHVRLLPVTDGDHTFWHWESRFDAPVGRENELKELVAEGVYQGGFDAIRQHMGIAQ
ncbi:MAG: SRPBCC family protein, partial [Pseudomonadota bacterium]